MSAAASRHVHPHHIPHVHNQEQALADAVALNTALKKFFTDATSVWDIMCKRTHLQLQDIAVEYKNKFGKSLMDDCKENTSGHFEALLIGLNMTPCEFDAYRINKATKGLGTNEDEIIEIVAHREPKDVVQINEIHQRDYGKNAMEAIQSEVSGELGHILSLLVNPTNERKEPPADKYEAQLEADTRDLFAASQDKLVGHEILPFINVLGNHNRIYLARLYAHYANKHGKTVDGIISSWTLQGAAVRTLLAIMTPPEEYYADLLYHSMKGLVTSDDQLIRIIVEQRERNLPKIAEFFLHKYKKSLHQWVVEDTMGKYGHALAVLLEFYASAKEMA